MNYCKKCGIELRDGATYCDKCGTKCNIENKTEEIFVYTCPSCGSQDITIDPETNGMGCLFTFMLFFIFILSNNVIFAIFVGILSAIVLGIIQAKIHSNRITLPLKCKACGKYFNGEKAPIGMPTNLKGDNPERGLL